MIVQTIPMPRSRRTDPITSHLAAQSARPLQMTHLEQILAALQQHGAGTIDTIADWTGLSAVQVARRLPELQQQGLASPTGKLGLSVCGRLEREWEAV